MSEFYYNSYIAAAAEMASVLSEKWRLWFSLSYMDGNISLAESYVLCHGGCEKCFPQNVFLKIQRICIPFQCRQCSEKQSLQSWSTGRWIAPLLNKHQPVMLRIQLLVNNTMSSGLCSDASRCLLSSVEFPLCPSLPTFFWQFLMVSFAHWMS